MEANDFEKDLRKMMELATVRMQKIEEASPVLELRDPISALSRQLHPEMIRLSLDSIREETPTARTYRFKAAGEQGELPFFRPGQYLSVKFEIAGKRVTRPYSISSAPSDLPGALELTVSRKEGGFVSGYIWEAWREGAAVEATGPHGDFTFEPLRDCPRVVGIAGGSGVTPFRSMIREIIGGGLELELLLLYGSRREDEIIFAAELEALAAKAPQKVRVVHVISEPGPGWQGPKGFIDASIIREYAGALQDTSFFVCGPPPMYRFARAQLDELGIERRQVRFELAGAVDDVTGEPGYPARAGGKVFSLTIHLQGREFTVPAAAGESLLVALERAGLAPDSQCRSGECGFCRSRLAQGDVYIRQDSDGRRAADRLLNFIHPCAAYPLTDIILFTS